MRRVGNELESVAHPAVEEGLDALLTRGSGAANPERPAVIAGGVSIGRLVGLRDGTEPLVLVADQPGAAAIAARATVDLTPEQIGEDVVLVFADGDPRQPIVIGLLRPRPSPRPGVVPVVEMGADGTTLTVSSARQLVLRCGKASITLTSAGKVLIQGEYVSSHSSGVLRIKGGSVQIN